MKADVAVKVDGVSKSFILPHEKSGSIKNAFLRMITKDRGYEVQRVLDDISFSVEKGEFFGIVGRNGSGKSTLLKMLAGIYAPDKGSIIINGRLTPFIELGVGFSPELSGRENVYLNGALFGFSEVEMRSMYDDIVEFAELERFMDQKLKNYSSGMQVRLAFSIAIRANSDILVLDEVLAVGDEAFQRKCFDHFFKLKREKKTVILVTHSMDSVRQFCDRAIFIDEGRIKLEGGPDKVSAAYSGMFLSEYIQKIDQADDKQINPEAEQALSDVSISSIGIVQHKKMTKIVNFREDFSVKVTLKAKNNYPGVTLGVHLFDQAGRNMLALSTKTLENFAIQRGLNKIRFDIQNIFAEGEYYLALAVEQKEGKKLLIKETELAPFSIVGLDLSRYSSFGLTHPDFQIKLGDDA